MTEEAGTLNNDQEANVDDSSESTKESSPEFFDTVGLSEETIDDGASAETEKTGDSEEDKAKAEAEAKAKADEAKAGDDKTEEDDEKVPWHKDPRFQEFMKERNDLHTFKDRALKAEGKLEALEPKKDEETKEDFTNIADMSDEELTESIQDNPKEFAANLARQIRAETKAELLNEIDDRSFKDKVDVTYEEYKKDNPDFIEKWNSGELRTFIDSHPGHNAISAYQVITSQSKETDTKKTLDEAVAKAVKETEERMTKNFKAKQGLQHLEGGPTGGQARISEDISPELKDTKKFGGATTVLTERLRQLRSKGQS